MPEGDNTDQKQPDQPDAGWSYKPDTSPGPAPAAANETVEWTASEFIEHNKGFSWYLALAAIGLVVAGLVYLLTRDLVSSVVICIFALILGIAGARKPNVIAYKLDSRGLSAGRRFRPYSEFKSFALVDEGAFNSITLLPIKRNRLPVNLYLAPDVEHQILEVLGSHLPMQQGGLDITDNLMRRMHF